MLQVHVAVLKEPRGFIKILQFLLAILAFSTTVSVSTYFTFHATVKDCQEGNNDVVRKDVDYPFALDSAAVRQNLCQNPPRSETFHFATDTSAAAKFFVAIGVLCMMYAVVALLVYVLLSELYESNRLLSSADFVMHVALAFLWLVCSAMWASDAGTLKNATDPQRWLADVCSGLNNVMCQFTGADHKGSFGKLNASLCFGFLNMFVWAANLWFIFKETAWYRARPAAETGVGAGSNSA